MPSEVPDSIRPFRKLLRAVAELHVRGYQRLRIVPWFYDLGTWRCTILPARYVSRSHGAKWAEGTPEEMQARYTSASEREYWGWKDDHLCSPSELAEVFLERHPRLAALGYGEDWLYAGWYQHMLHLTYPEALPLSWNDQDPASLDESRLGMLGRDRGTIPPPPPGYAESEAEF